MTENINMCRLFGFKSVLDSQVHSSLIHADNALASQSVRHPDGWGVAYYREGVPHLIRSTDRAVDDHIFHKVSGVVSSKNVIAHIRKATQGNHTLLNCHPFQYGKWVFAHNGNLKNFENYRAELLKLLAPKLRPFVLGTTDSEILFYLLLSFIHENVDLGAGEADYQVVQAAVQKLLDVVTHHTGPLYGGKEQRQEESHITFLLSTGNIMIGFNGGQFLNYSTHKSSCPENKTCPHYNQTCENQASSNSKINHLIFSSEIHEGENIWKEMELGELIGVDGQMTFNQDKLTVDFITNPPS